VQADPMRVPMNDGKTQPYFFVTTMRFWSMFAVVAFHCLSVFGMLGDPMDRVRFLLDTPVKFGTIGFFLISGFLLGDKLQTCPAGEYLLRRVKRLFLPWLFWYMMLVGYFMVQTHHDAHSWFRFNAGELSIGAQALFDALFLSPLWFVPNLLLGICVLLMFRRYLYSVRLGLGLFVFTVFYAVNIYFEWIPSIHPEALLGFIFYLWLGSYISHRRKDFQAWLKTVPMGLLIVLAVMGGAMAWVECNILLARHSKDPVNILRISNQIFSILMALLLAKFQRRSWPKFVHVRHEMFGVYLSHTIVLMTLLRAGRYCLRGAQRSPILHSGWGMAMIWLLTMVVVWGICLGVTKRLSKGPKTRWIVGAVADERVQTQEDALSVA
jgi:membrane-bound acyltransferase YfiQ involved in biofilm formation